MIFFYSLTWECCLDIRNQDWKIKWIFKDISTKSCLWFAFQVQNGTKQSKVLLVQWFICHYVQDLTYHQVFYQEHFILLQVLITKLQNTSWDTCFVDASFGSDSSDHKSTTGYIILLCGSPISWISKKQSLVALSTLESEYIALSSYHNQRRQPRGNCTCKGPKVSL